MPVRMTVPDNTSKNTTAFFIQAAAAFGISLVTALGGIICLPLDAWQPMFLASR